MADDESRIALAAKSRDVIAFLGLTEKAAPASRRRDEPPAGAFTSAEASADGREDRPRKNGS